MALRVAGSKMVAFTLLATGVACLTAAIASADDVGGEDVTVPPPETAAEEPEEDAGPWKPPSTPIQLSIAPSYQLLDSDVPVYGLRLNIPVGRQDDVTGVDVGGFNQVDGALRGLQAGLINSAKGSVRGAQIGFTNWSGGELAGLQLGLFNIIDGEAGAGQIGLLNSSKRHTGFQIGVINLTEHLTGVQIGAVNYIESRKPLTFLPVVNVGW